LIQSIDEFFLERVAAMGDGHAQMTDADGYAAPPPDVLDALFFAQAQSRHLDFAAHWLQSQGRGYYTIASAGHEGNATLGFATRVDDPALLHYRSGGFFAARAAKAAVPNGRPPQGLDPLRSVLLGLSAAAADPISGGRHKVFGDASLHVIPQTSTIASHLPRAVGLAYALGQARATGWPTPWPPDAIVVCSFGDASVNHSTAQGALNAAAYLRHRGLPVPLLFVCEDNGIGISTPSPPGWVERSLRRFPGIDYAAADGCNPPAALADVEAAVDGVRATRSPRMLHLATVRLLGHAGSDVETGYRSRRAITGDYERDPLLRTAALMICTGVMSPREVIGRYEAIRARVMQAARSVLDEPSLPDREAVMRPLALPSRDRALLTRWRPAAPPAARETAWGGRLPESLGRLTLAQAINAALADVLATHDAALLFGQDVAVKGGVYGVTRTLRKRFGSRRVFDTLLDEQTILGTALGAALAVFLPLPEIQYLAYLHNAEDQLRGEAASLRFFSDGQYQNPMVVRIAGFAYQKGFGGHFHNDNSIAVLRDIPGLVVCVPSHPADAPGLLRASVDLAQRDGRVCVVVEPIALYHERDLFETDDGQWTASYQPPVAYQPPRDGRRRGDDPSAPTTFGFNDRAFGAVRLHGDGPDLLVVTFGNGVRMSLRAARRLAEQNVRVTVMDLMWLSPLPEASLMEAAARFDTILVADETRASGGVAEAVLATLHDRSWRGRARRVTSSDSYIPLGPAADHVLLSERQIETAALSLVGRGA